MSEFDRSELITLAESCFQNGLFSDVTSYMKEVIKMGTPLSYNERRLTFDSYQILKKTIFNNYYFCENLLMQ